MKDSQRVIDELSCNIDRDTINKDRLQDVKKLLHEINNRNSYRGSFFNKILSKIGINHRVEETNCNDGVYTDFDFDNEFMDGLKMLLEQREQRIINHAKKFIIEQDQE